MDQMVDHGRFLGDLPRFVLARRMKLSQVCLTIFVQRSANRQRRTLALGRLDPRETFFGWLHLSRRFSPGGRIGWRGAIAEGF